MFAVFCNWWGNYTKTIEKERGKSHAFLFSMGNFRIQYPVTRNIIISDFRDEHAFSSFLKLSESY